MLVRGAVDVPEQRAALHAHHPRRRVDRDLVHRRQVDHEPVVDAAEPGAVVAAAAHRDPEAALAREPNRGGDIRLVDAVRDRRRMLVDHCVVESAGVVVARVLPALDHAPLHGRSETFDTEMAMTPPA